MPSFSNDLGTQTLSAVEIGEWILPEIIAGTYPLDEVIVEFPAALI